MRKVRVSITRASRILVFAPIDEQQSNPYQSFGIGVLLLAKITPQSQDGGVDGKFRSLPRFGA